MSNESAPLSAEERAELEALRAEKVARERREQAARERAELEALRLEHAAAQRPQGAAARPVSARPTEEDVRIAEARERGERLMKPDDDLSMPLGQKIVLGVLALLVIIVVVLTRLLG